MRVPPAPLGESAAHSFQVRGGAIGSPLADHHRSSMMVLEVSVESMIDAVLRLKGKLIPKRGFNVVGIDGFSQPGDDDLYIVGHFETRAEAEAALAHEVAQQPRGPSAIPNKFYIYEPGTR